MIVVLNGASSAGKTSVARELQELLPGYPLNFSIDSILYALPPPALRRMTTGGANPGLSYALLEEGFYACARALADLGHDLIVDNAIVSAASAGRMVCHLGHLPAIVVGIHCDLAALEQREAARGDRTLGEAAGQYDAIHRHVAYDLTVDTTAATPRQTATEITTFLATDPTPAAMDHTARRLTHQSG